MLVGLHGYKGSGKDTFYHRYCHIYPQPNPERLAFADGLKRFICNQLGIDLEEYEYLLKNPHLMARVQVVVPPPTAEDEPAYFADMPIRRFTQRTGTEVGQEVLGTNVWVDLTLPRPDQIEWPVKNQDNVAVRGIDYENCLWHASREIFITDVRYTHEADRIKQLGGSIIAIDGPDSEKDTHSSEQPLPERYIYYRVDNRNRNDDFETLDEQIFNIFTPKVIYPHDKLARSVRDRRTA